MKTINYNGREIKTNLGENYSVCDGNDKKTMKMFLKEFRETDGEMFKRIAEKGYNKITFYHTTTAVRGYYHTIAFAK